MFSVAVLGVMLDLGCLPDEEEMVLPNKGHKYSASALPSSRWINNDITPRKEIDTEEADNTHQRNPDPKEIILL